MAQATKTVGGGGGGGKSKKRKPEAQAPALEPEAVQPVMPKVATAEEWKNAAVVIKLITLPSGISVRVKQLTVMEAAALGHMGLDLVASVVADTARLAGPVNLRDNDIPWGNITEEQVLKMLDMYRRIAVACCVEPVLSFKPGKGEMDVKDILFDDLTTIWAAGVKGGAAELQNFRQRPETRSKTIRGGKAVQREA